MSKEKLKKAREFEQEQLKRISPEERPCYHVTGGSGWINDPNGLIYSEGKYHLYFQHNPVDVNWGNMSWGHAESTDLLHWVQKEDVMFPDENGTMFSGCAILNERGLLGLPKDTPVFFYTVAGSASEWSKGKKFVQRIAYSTDQGETLTKIEENVLEHIEADNRDPKVYWHEEKQLYYMVQIGRASCRERV